MLLLFCFLPSIFLILFSRYERVSVDGDEVDSERTESGCVPQYQSTTVRVLTHFMALGADGLGQQDFLLGSDWQVDVTDLVQDSLRVEDQRVARLLKGQVLMGLSTGTAKLQVREKEREGEREGVIEWGRER